jgi:hypothetical protein
MEYLVGSFVTLACVLVLNKLMFKRLPVKAIKISNSQSQLYKILSEISYVAIEKENKSTQSSDYMHKTHLKIMIVEKKAYWIKENQLYVAEYNRNGVIEETAKQVDTMGMDAVELKHTMFVVEKLTEGNGNDNRS